MKAHVILSALMLCSMVGFGQDVMYKVDGEQVEVKVLEVTPNEIKYKLKSNLEGPTYVLPKTDIYMLEYANGNKDVFAGENKAKSGSVVNIKKNEMTELEQLYYKRNTIGIPVTAIGALGVVLTTGLLVDGLIDLRKGTEQAKSQSATSGAFCVLSLVSLGIGVDNLVKASIIKKRLDNGDVQVTPKMLNSYSFEGTEIHQNNGFGFQVVYTF